VLAPCIKECFQHIHLACDVVEWAADEAVLQPVLDEMGGIGAKSSSLRARQQQQQQHSAILTET